MPNHKKTREQLLRLPYLTTGQIARLIGVATRTVTKAIDSGRLKGHRIGVGSDRRVARKNFAEYVRKNGIYIEGFDEKDRISAIAIGCDAAALTMLTVAFGEDELKLTAVDDVFEAGVLMGQIPPDLIVIDGSMGSTAYAAIMRSIEKASVGTSVMGIGEYDDGEIATLESRGVVVVARPVDPNKLAEAARAIAEAVREKNQ